MTQYFIRFNHGGWQSISGFIYAAYLITFPSVCPTDVEYTLAVVE